MDGLARRPEGAAWLDGMPTVSSCWWAVVMQCGLSMGAFDWFLSAIFRSVVHGGKADDGTRLAAAGHLATLTVSSCPNRSFACCRHGRLPRLGRDGMRRNTLIERYARLTLPFRIVICVVGPYAVRDGASGIGWCGSSSVTSEGKGDESR